MSKDIIQLFVMKNCQICPQMERVFLEMHENGAIDRLVIIDVGEHPEVAEKYNVRSVPHYLLNGVAFYGLRTASDIKLLLQQDLHGKWQEIIKSELSEGQLETVEKIIRENPVAVESMILLLENADTSLVVRIGLSAIIESLAGSGLLNSYDAQFINLTMHKDERIAIDAIYFLSLIATEESIKQLMDLAEHGQQNLRVQAVDILQDMTDEVSLR